ncbi:MAG: glycosyltransferase family 4 protein [Burkholderiaceae bacterium]|nr:glycosyltransferase family 4 protein [Burkholderiaceae bacterium]
MALFSNAGQQRKERMPKILLVNNYHYRRGGADVVYLEQGRLLRERGWEVVEFSMQHPQNEPSRYADSFCEEIEYGRPYSALTKLRHATKIVYSFEAAAKMRALIERERPDVVHAHNVYHHLSPSVLHAAGRCGVPVLLTTHDLKLLCPAISMLCAGQVCEECRTRGRFSVVRKRCQKGSLALSMLVFAESTLHDISGIYRKSIDRLISPSRFFIEKFAEWGWPGAPFSHIPNFVDVESLHPEFRPGKYFVYFGRLSAEKGLKTLVAAAANAGVEVRLVGTGPIEEDLRRQADQFSANVRFCGFLKGEALWQTVRESRAVVLASEWYENAPLTILEAYACGKPALGSRIGGIPELIQPGKTGQMFESGNSLELADVLRSYAEMPDGDVEAQGRYARAWVETDFTIERHANRLIDAYRLAGVMV